LTAVQGYSELTVDLPAPGNDAEPAFTRALELPTFEVEGVALIRRLTLMVRDGVIERVFYPVFPPDRNARGVADRLENEAPESKRSL
jgi:hypothetical protein